MWEVRNNFNNFFLSVLTKRLFTRSHLLKMKIQSLNQKEWMVVTEMVALKTTLNLFLLLIAKIVLTLHEFVSFRSFISIKNQFSKICSGPFSLSAKIDDPFKQFVSENAWSIKKRENAKIVIMRNLLREHRSYRQSENETHGF